MELSGITTNHPAPELLTGFGGVHKKVEGLERENRKLSRLITSNSSRAAIESDILSVAQVARLLGKSEKTMKRWADREYDPMPAIKVFRNQQYSWSFNRADVLEWFNLHRQS